MLLSVYPSVNLKFYAYKKKNVICLLVIDLKLSTFTTKFKQFLMSPRFTSTRETSTYIYIYIEQLESAITSKNTNFPD